MPRVRTERRETQGDKTDSPLVTMDGDVVGTPSYMPPEQARGELGKLGPHSDVYALGAMLYQLIGGEMAHGAVGDFVLENDKVRVVVQRPLRSIGPNPYGGVIIDADLKRAAGTIGRDQMGKLGLLYQFGRTVNARTVERDWLKARTFLSACLTPG